MTKQEILREEAKTLASRVEKLAKTGGLLDGTVEEINSLKERIKKQVLEEKEDILAKYMGG